MKLLVDENLPPRLASALHVLFEPEHQITALRTKFNRPNVSDEESRRGNLRAMPIYAPGWSASSSAPPSVNGHWHGSARE